MAEEAVGSELVGYRKQCWPMCCAASLLTDFRGQRVCHLCCDRVPLLSREFLGVGSAKRSHHGLASVAFHSYSALPKSSIRFAHDFVGVWRLEPHLLRRTAEQVRASSGPYVGGPLCLKSY